VAVVFVRGSGQNVLTFDS
ncbi:hypothetical protein KIPB_008035, partial [Kipferlia bialata]